jgi:hypothetical protein
MRLPSSIKNKKIEVKTNFNLNTDDFNIQIRFLVKDKIAKT